MSHRAATGLASTALDEGAGTRDSITGLAMTRAILPGTLLADPEGTDQLVLDHPFRGLRLVNNFTGAGPGQTHWVAGLSRLQIDVNGSGMANRQVDLTGVGANFDAATDLIL